MKKIKPVKYKSIYFIYLFYFIHFDGDLLPYLPTQALLCLITVYYFNLLF